MQVELRRATHPMIGPLLDNHVSIVIPFVRLLQQLETFDKDNYTFTFLTFHEEEKLCTEICISCVCIQCFRQCELLPAIEGTVICSFTYKQFSRNI